MVDLDELDRKRAALPTTIMAYAPHLLPPDEPIVVMYTQSAADIINAYPALAAEVRALRAKLAERDAELIALREVVAAARAFVPTCEETHVPDGGDEPVSCGQRATHIDRLIGHDLGPICAEHAELSLANARKAASNGWTRAIETDAPRAIEPNARVDRLAEALAKVPR